MPRRSASWLLGASLALLLPVAGLSQNQKKVPDVPEVVDVKLRGVENVDQEELIESIYTDESHCKSLVFKLICPLSKAKYFYERKYLNHDELKRDVLRIKVFYWKRGYREAQVDTIVTPRGRNKVAVLFHVTEGKPTIVSSLEVVQPEQKVLSGKEIERRVILGKNGPLNLLRLDSSKVFLESRLWDKGYADAIVDTSITLNDSAKTADVKININPRRKATVADIVIEGENRVDERTIGKSLTFKEKEIFQRSDMLASQRKLYESNLFKRAAIELPAQEDSAKIVVVTVQESPPREARLSAGFNTVDFFQVDGRFSHYNFTGGARQLQVQATIGNLLASSLNGKSIFSDVTGLVQSGDRARYLAPTYQASVEMRQPWFGSPQNELAVSTFAHRRSAPGIYVDRGYGTSATFTRELTLRAPASLNYRFEVTAVDAGDVYFCVNYGVCDSPTLSALRNYQRMSPLILTASLDRSDDPFSPRKGIRGKFDAEHASGFTGSNFRYNRSSGDGSFYYPMRKRGTLAGHLRLGWVRALSSTLSSTDATLEGNSDVLHPRKRFYAGGSRSVRGYGENQLGPRVLTIDPDVLRQKDSTCVSVLITQCSPEVSGLRDRDFEPRPLGGNIVAEVSTEFRFPIWQELFGAMFIDAGYVAQTINRDLPRSRVAITPGFGVRYKSLVGPIRIDLGINPRKTEKLPVVTEEIVNGERKLVTLSERRTYAPSGRGGLLNRLTLHLSIGEAY